MRGKTLKYWESKEYYDRAERASKQPHRGMRLISRLAKGADTIVDLGCGEGTRLVGVAGGRVGRVAIGVDISRKAIEIAQEKYKNIKFVRGDLEKLPLKTGAADLVYSAFVLEHTNDPEKVLVEAVRVAKNGGDIVFVAPNYGAPNRCSPPFRGSRIRKLLVGLLNDFLNIEPGLGWRKVKPIVAKYEMDFDTTVEPYVKTLLTYLNGLGAEIVYWDTCWEEELPNVKIHQRFFRLLGEGKVYPFRYWGPHMVVHAVKH